MAAAAFQQIPLPPELLSRIGIKTLETVDELPEEVEKRSFFFVTDEVFDKVRATRYKNAFRCSELEVECINEILKGEGGDTDRLTVNDFLFAEDIKCERCQRQLNFYDVFLQGVSKHGLGFLKWAMVGPKKVQMFPASTVQTFNCSGCKHSMVRKGAYGHYVGGGYGCV